MWSCLLARELAKFGYLVVVPDYRNFPQGNMEDMIADTIAAISWTKSHISLFGGDPSKIVLSGQSAGAHITLCTVIALYQRSMASNAQLAAGPSQWAASTPIPERGHVTTAGGIDTAPATAAAEDNRSQAAESASDEEFDDWRSVSTALASRYSARKRPAAHAGATESECPSPASSSSGSCSEGNTTLPQTEGCSTAAALQFTPARSRNGDRSRSDSSGATSDDVRIEDVKLFVGVSGPYNLKALQAHLHFRGLDSSIVDWICLGNVLKYSPTHSLAQLLGVTLSCQCLCQCQCAHPALVPAIRVQAVSSSTAVEAVAIPVESGETALSAGGFVAGKQAIAGYVATSEILIPDHSIDPTKAVCSGSLTGFPRVALFHGCKDLSIPASVSSELASILATVGADPVLRLYREQSHTDAILEGLFSGDCKMLHDIAECVEAIVGTPDGDLSSENNIKSSKKQPPSAPLPSAQVSAPLVSPFLCKIARFVNPF
jgi:hypothetical protein